MPRQKMPWKQRFAWLGWLVGAVVIMGVVGYLLAAIVLFPSPLRTSEREVPHLIGMGELDAQREVGRLGLIMDITAREPHPLEQPGTVIWQDPPPGVAVPRNFRVELAVSNGLPRVIVPNLRGFDGLLAARLLAAAGLGLDNIDSTSDSGQWPDNVSVPSGTVASTSPPAGDSVPLGLRVLVHVTR